MKYHSHNSIYEVKYNNLMLHNELLLQRIQNTTTLFIDLAQKQDFLKNAYFIQTQLHCHQIQRFL